MWDLRGWKRLTVRDAPPLIAAREELLAWLAEVSKPHRVDLDARLRSKDDNHFSARLQLFVHNYFHSRGWGVQVHPTVAQSPNHPDFLVEKADASLVVECRIVLDPAAVVQQDQRLRQLADNAGKTLERAVLLLPLSDLPPNIPAKRIRAWLEGQRSRRHP